MSKQPRVALIAGVTGVAGLNLAKNMLSSTGKKYGTWVVYGISRRTSPYLPEGVHHVSCDLQDPTSCKAHLTPLGEVTHVFFTTWVKCKDEDENCEVNSAMLRNLLDNLSGKLQHVVLLTGLKHYIGPFSAFGEKHPPLTPYKESFPRLSNINFYYDLEDTLFEKAKERRFAWSVARPNAIIGFTLQNQMNLGMSIAVYASICKYAGRPFTFPGNDVYYDAVVDITDANLLAEHMMWEAATPSAANNAFNVVNGGVFRWRQMWKSIADYFNLEVPDYPGHPTNITAMQGELEPIWEEMKIKFGLKPLSLAEVSTFWLLDMSFSKVFDLFGDMTKSREMGFLLYQNSEKTFTNLFDHLREQKIIPR